VTENFQYRERNEQHGTHNSQSCFGLCSCCLVQTTARPKIEGDGEFPIDLPQLPVEHTSNTSQGNPRADSVRNFCIYPLPVRYVSLFTLPVARLDRLEIVLINSQSSFSRCSCCLVQTTARPRTEGDGEFPIDLPRLPVSH
jgi:hypothetical protein